MRTPVGPVLAGLLLAALAACSSAAPDSTEVSEAAVTTTGLAHEGASCLSSPVYRTEKCAEGLVCNQAPQAAHGVCVRPGAEGKGTGVVTTGASGTPCHTDLVQNECDKSTSCVGTGNANLGVCRPNNPMDWSSCPSDGTNPPVHADPLFQAVGGDLGPVIWATQSRFCTKQKDGSLVCPPWGGAGSMGESGRATLHPTVAPQGSDLDFIGYDGKATVSCLDAKGGSRDWGCYSAKAPNDATTSYSLVVTAQCLVLRTSTQQNVAANDSRFRTQYGSVLQIESGALARY